jgi:hypothetical protein
MVVPFLRDRSILVYPNRMIGYKPEGFSMPPGEANFIWFTLAHQLQSSEIRGSIGWCGRLRRTA